MRTCKMTRKTAETDICLELNLDGAGKSSIDTGVGFLNHMLTLFAAHGKFDLTVVCRGDTEVDDHHSVEDIGICLGTAFRETLGDKRGITRYGSFLLPMDEALILCAVDLSGSPDLSKIAEAYKVRFLRLSDPDKMQETIDEFLRDDDSVLMECVINPMDTVK